MILIGDKLIPHETITKIFSIEDIAHTEPNSTVLFDYDLELIKYCHNNSLKSAVIVKTIVELIYVSQFDVAYIICNKELAQDAQKIADNYLFDAKTLMQVNNSDEIPWVAKNEIDGAIYKGIL